MLSFCVTLKNRLTRKTLMSSDWSIELHEELNKLLDKYALSGQESVNFVKGLNSTQYLGYWDYINLETLLSIQQPRTVLADEKIFITYHQITELYFSLILHELKKVRSQQTSTEEEWLTLLDRVNRYFQQLILSFDVMIKGLKKEDFLMFRMALLPASGFQSVQYRLIEFACTELKNLIAQDARQTRNQDAAIESMYENIYWKSSNKVSPGKQKALTLTLFEEKYDHVLKNLIKQQQHANIAYRYEQAENNIKNNQQIIDGLKKLDKLANLAWPLKHFQAASQFLKSPQEVMSATGGTNWQSYLPPKYQCIQFFPFLWTEEEIQHWGKHCDWQHLLA